MCRYNKHCTAGCNKCQPLNQSNKTSYFIDLALTIQGMKYDYSKVKYVNTRTKVCIICPEHGEFWQTPEKHLKRRQGCPKCSGVLNGIMRTRYILKSRFEGLVQPEDYKLIPLTQGKYAIVDNEDFDRLKDINWKFNGGYAHNNNLGRLHRNIMDVKEGDVVDHIDGNPLNNRRNNLRVCTQQENIYNSRPSRTNVSKYKGVTKLNEDKYLARIYKEGKVMRIGLFSSAEEAGRAYDTKAKELFGEFAYLNFK